MGDKLPILNDNQYKDITQCEICKNNIFSRLFLLKSSYVTKCNACHFIFLNPQPTDDDLKKIYDENHFIQDDSKHENSNATLKQLTAKLYLEEILQYCDSKKGKLLEIGCGQGDFLEAAEAEGWVVTGTDFSPDACKKTQARLKNGEV